MATLAILPIKSFDDAKQRLGTSVEPVMRRLLVQAMVADVLIALRRVKGIAETVAVTSDDEAQRIAAAYGATLVADPGGGHNGAAARGLRYALEHGYKRAALLPGDCPALAPAELEALLERSPGSCAVVVPDRHGTGTNALVLCPPDLLEPSFGPGSRARHVHSAQLRAAPCEVVDVPTLALDVDTPADLDALEALLSSTHGGAAHTRGILRRMHAVTG